MKNPTLTNPQPSSGATRTDAPKESGELRQKVGQAAGQVANVAQDTAREAKRAASSLAAEANQSIKGIMNDQLGAGADLVANVAQSARAAAETLDKSAPQIAGLVRSAAERIEDFSDGLRGRSIDDVFKMTSDYARRQPLVLFGTAATLGLLALRIFNSSPPRGKGPASAGAA